MDLGTSRIFQVFKGTTGGVETISAVLPCDTALSGAMASTQAFILGGGWELCNAVDLTLGVY